MVKKLSPYERAKKSFAQQLSTSHARYKEATELIADLKREAEITDETIEKQHKQLLELSQKLVNPPYILEAATTQAKLKQLESQVLSYGRFVQLEKDKSKVLRAQLLMANRALSQFLKPTA